MRCVRVLVHLLWGCNREEEEKSDDQVVESEDLHMSHATSNMSDDQVVESEDLHTHTPTHIQLLRAKTTSMFIQPLTRTSCAG